MGAGTIARSDARLAGTHHPRDPARPPRRARRCATGWPRRSSRASEIWCDLGCGNGVAAADALGGSFAGRAVLVDVDEERAEAAARELGASDAVAFVADLNEPADVERVRARLRRRRRAARGHVLRGRRAPARRSSRSSRCSPSSPTDEDTTVLLSVPNDAFWAIENPYHETMWGEGVVRGAAPHAARGHASLVRQVAAAGLGHRAADGEDPRRTTADVRPATARDAVPTHFLAVDRPARGRARPPHAAVAQVDLDEQRRWERQRESDLAFLQAQAEKWRAELQQHHEWFERVAGYIHDLEGRLGLPPSRRVPRGAARAARRVKVAFLVNDLQLSGGVGVVVEHARQLARHHGFDVDARARPRAGGAALGLRRAPRASTS